MTARHATPRQRADLLLVERGLFDSRARAQAAIAAGLVRAGGVPVRKPSEALARDAEIEAEPAHPYVSRGGVKLTAALDAFAVPVAGHRTLDVGASTGGFTDALLRRGAAHVIAVDTGHGQLHASLRGDPRVTSLEGTDVRRLDPAHLGGPIDLVTIDVSFIPLALALPAALALATPGAHLVALVKPQFEAGRGHVGRGGIVRDEVAHRLACERVEATVASLGWRTLGVMPSPLLGGDGNAEFLLAAVRPSDPPA